MTMETAPPPATRPPRRRGRPGAGCSAWTAVAAAALGRAVAGASMLLRLASKTPSRLVLDIRGDGPLRQVLVEVDQEGNIRSTVGDPRVVVPDYPNTKLAVGHAVGAGQLRVLREFGDGGSYQSQVQLVSGEIGD